MTALVIKADDFGQVWGELVGNILATGEIVSPRGMPIREHRNTTLLVHDGTANILMNPIRKPSYRFMVAEWLWIWFGRDDVETISRYNPNIAQFSDDGETFAGAYGPRVRSQWQRVSSILANDPESRQAIIQIYHANLAPTKDVPCTLALQFFVRNGRLETAAYMRSSDVWLGLPYDFFNFSMLGNIMAAQHGLPIGSVTMHLGSSHLYAAQEEAATDAISFVSETLRSPVLPGMPEVHLDYALRQPDEWAKQTLHTQRPWMHYGGVLASPDNKTALAVLKSIWAHENL